MNTKARDDSRRVHSNGDGARSETEIEDKIRAEFHPVHPVAPDVEAIAKMGHAATSVLIKLFRDPQTESGNMSQPLLAATLASLAQEGDSKAYEFLKLVAAKKVAVLDDRTGEAAVRVATNCIQSKAAEESKTSKVAQQAASKQHSQTAKQLPVGKAVKKAAGGISVYCPSCDAKLKFNLELAGRAVKCSKCKNRFRFPTTALATTGSTPHGRAVMNQDRTHQVSSQTAARPLTSSKSQSRQSETVESALRECHNLAKRSSLPFKLREAVAIGGWFFLLAGVFTFIWAGVLAVIWLANVTDSAQDISALARLVAVLCFFILPVVILGAIAIGLILAIVITARRFTVWSLFDYFIRYSTFPYKTPWRLERLVPPSQRTKAQMFRLLDQLGPTVGNYYTKSLELGPITKTDVEVSGRVAMCTVPIAKANEFLLPVATLTLNAVQSRAGDWYLVLPESEELSLWLDVLRPLAVEPPGESITSSEREGPYDGLKTCIHCRNRVFLPARGICPICKQASARRSQSDMRAKTRNSGIVTPHERQVMDDKKQDVDAREGSCPTESTGGKTNRPPLPSKPNLPKGKPLPSKAEHDNSQTTNVGQHVASLQEAPPAEHLPVGAAVKNAAGGIRVLCPSCDAKLKFNPQLAGRVVKCSKCKTQFRFPSPHRTSSTESSVATPRLPRPPARSASSTQVYIDPSDPTTPLSDLVPAADTQVQRHKSNSRFVKHITVPLALVFVASVIWIVMLIASNNVDTLRQDFEDLVNAHKADHSISSDQSAFPILGLIIAVFGVLPLSAAILGWNWAFEAPAPFVEEHFTLSQRRIVIGSVGIVFIVIGILVSVGIGF